MIFFLSLFPLLNITDSNNKNVTNHNGIHLNNTLPSPPKVELVHCHKERSHCDDNLFIVDECQWTAVPKFDNVDT